MKVEREDIRKIMRESMEKELAKGIEEDVLRFDEISGIWVHRDYPYSNSIIRYMKGRKPSGRLIFLARQKMIYRKDTYYPYINYRGKRRSLNEIYKRVWGRDLPGLQDRNPYGT